MVRLPLPLTMLLALAVPAAAQAPVGELSFSPAKPAKATTGTLAARDLPPDPEGAPPVDLLAVALQKGFLADPKGAPGRCTEGEASQVSCPEPSQIGRGTAQVEASFLGSTRLYTATLGVFVTAERDAGDLAGLSIELREPETGTVVAVPGRVVRAGRAGGPELRFEELSKAVPTPPPGFEVRMKSFELSVGRKRTVTRRVRTKSGRRKRVRTTHAILTTPKTCAGAWTATLVIGRTDGSEATQPLSAACGG